MSTNETVRETVRNGYAAIAELGAEAGVAAPVCCGAQDSATQIAHAAGYDDSELTALPEGANMGLSCGNPVALASIQPGEVVVDLGSGGGFDVFIAGRKTGPTGRAIGVDMTAEMLSKARKNVVVYRERNGFENVEFRLGEIEHLPLADRSADVIISNCVINLSPDKPQVWREIARVLKPGGRVAVSDLALTQPLPTEVAEMAEALVGCIAGAVLVSETDAMARAAGLTGIQLREKPGIVDAMTDINDPLYQRMLEAMPSDTKPSDYIVSLEVNAVKPTGSCCG